MSPSGKRQSWDLTLARLAPLSPSPLPVISSYLWYLMKALCFHKVILSCIIVFKVLAVFFEIPKLIVWGNFLKQNKAAITETIWIIISVLGVLQECAEDEMRRYESALKRPKPSKFCAILLFIYSLYWFLFLHEQFLNKSIRVSATFFCPLE